MKNPKKFKEDLQEIMNICLQFCQNRKPDSATKQTFKAIYEIAERAKADSDMLRLLCKYEKDRKKTAKILKKKNYETDESKEYYYTKKLDDY